MLLTCGKASLKTGELLWQTYPLIIVHRFYVMHMGKHMNTCIITGIILYLIIILLLNLKTYIYIIYIQYYNLVFFFFVCVCYC